VKRALLLSNATFATAIPDLIRPAQHVENTVVTGPGHTPTNIHTVRAAHALACVVIYVFMYHNIVLGVQLSLKVRISICKVSHM
jgi:hypothetical protein